MFQQQKKCGEIVDVARLENRAFPSECAKNFLSDLQNFRSCKNENLFYQLCKVQGISSVT